MKELRVTPPELSLIAGTRAMLGAGIALLTAERLDKEQRKAVGWTLFLAGLITTVPLGIMAFCKRDKTHHTTDSAEHAEPPYDPSPSIPSPS